MTSRIASGQNLVPSLMFGQPKPLGAAFPFTPEQLAVAHDGMFRVVNGSGTGVGSKLQLDGIQMAGKTGTAQVRALVGRGYVGDWKSRDHSLFVCYAPADKPRYAMAVVVEHGTFGARAAAPIARDVMTYLFDPGKAMDSLLALEKGWGGTPSQRMDAKYRSYATRYVATAPKVADDAALKAAMSHPEPAVEAQVVTPATTRPEEPPSLASPAPAPAPAVMPTVAAP